MIIDFPIYLFFEFGDENILHFVYCIQLLMFIKAKKRTKGKTVMFMTN